MKDKDIVLSIKNGNKDDFVKLYDKYIDKIYNFIYYKCLDKSTSEDITSQTFLDAFDNIDSFKEDKGSFSSWLYKIAYNNFMDNINYNKKQIKDTGEWFEQLIEDKKDILEDTDMSFKLEQIKNFLEKLSKDKKDIFIMRVWDGLSYDDIGKILNKTPESCRKNFSRTMKTMQENFGNILIALLFII